MAARSCTPTRNSDSITSDLSSPAFVLHHRMLDFYSSCDSAPCSPSCHTGTGLALEAPLPMAVRGTDATIFGSVHHSYQHLDVTGMVPRSRSHSHSFEGSPGVSLRTAGSPTSATVLGAATSNAIAGAVDPFCADPHATVRGPRQATPSVPRNALGGWSSGGPWSTRWDPALSVDRDDRTVVDSLHPRSGSRRTHYPSAPTVSMCTPQMSRRELDYRRLVDNEVEGINAMHRKQPPPSVTKLLDWLYIGNFPTDESVRILTREGVRCIINCCSADCKTEASVRAAFPIVVDLPACDANDYFIIANDAEQFSAVLRRCQRNGDKAFVHCIAGVNRSVTLCVAYLMEHCGLDLLESIKLFRQCGRYVILDNVSFRHQLVDHYLNVVKPMELSEAVDRPAWQSQGRSEGTEGDSLGPISSVGEEGGRAEHDLDEMRLSGCSHVRTLATVASTPVATARLSGNGTLLDVASPCINGSFLGDRHNYNEASTADDHATLVTQRLLW